MEQMENKGKRDRISWILFNTHIVFVLLAIALVVRIVWIMVAYKPMPEIERLLKPKVSLVKLEPVRGSILAKDGRLLAVSAPLYQVHMDCTVRKTEFARKKNREAQWLAKAKELSKGLAKIYGDKTADQYYNLIATGRRKGQKYVKIGYQIDHKTMLKVKELPLFNEGANKGGFILEQTDSRNYPFGSLARRTIGYVKNNHELSHKVGLEATYNEILHGKRGHEWTKTTDGYGKIHDFDSASVAVVDGKDIRTTLNIDIQDIADKAMRKRIADVPAIEGGCAIVMDVKTGGIRAMVNLKRDSNGNLGETWNYAINQAADPGSVFKAATLMTLLEDGKTTLETKVPTFYGDWKYNGVTFKDDYLNKKRHPESTISVIDGLEISSNHVFRYLACQNYTTKEEQKHFVNKYADYGLEGKFDFDLMGLAPAVLQKPSDKTWSGASLPSIAIGYSVLQTPLHIVTFYNAIANGGRLMKPYLVESIEENGKVVKRYGPEVLKRQICSKATADTLKRALRHVVSEGTGSAVRKAACHVSGKTGTSQIPYTVKIGGKDKVVYKHDGLKKHQATFVGFFPSEEPKYTAIVVVYSKLSLGNFYGGQYSAPVLNDIVNKVYAMDSQWGDKIERTASVPEMQAGDIEIGTDQLKLVPDVTGMGLSDALYSIENSGYRCSYSGIGHVTKQSPAAGTKLEYGNTVTLELK